jgi:putative transposase
MITTIVRPVSGRARRKKLFQEEILGSLANGSTKASSGWWCGIPALNRDNARVNIFKKDGESFSVQEEDYSLAVCRYVERNALRGNLVSRAEDWRWSSLWRWHQGNAV